MNEKIKQIITDTLKNYTIEKIILFGSRARGDFNSDSDYDILAIIKETPDWITRESLSAEIRKKAAVYDADIDILVRSKDYYESVKAENGNVISFASEEGIEM